MVLVLETTKFSKLSCSVKHGAIWENNLLQGIVNALKSSNLKDFIRQK